MVKDNNSELLKITPNQFLLEKSQLITHHLKSHSFKGIYLHLSEHIMDFAPLLFASHLKAQQISPTLLFMPDSQTNPALYQITEELSKHFNLTLKIVPIKFLQGLLKNMFQEHFSLEVTSTIHLKMVRAAILSNLCLSKKYLTLDATTQTMFSTGTFPYLPLTHTLCPFGKYDNAFVVSLLKENLPPKLFEQIQNIQLSSTPIDNSKPIDNHASQTGLNYFPII